MEKTGVDWLVKEFSDILGPLQTTPMQDMLMVDAIKKAKEMNRQQIIDAFDDGYFNGEDFRKPNNGTDYFTSRYGN